MPVRQVVTQLKVALGLLVLEGEQCKQRAGV